MFGAQARSNKAAVLFVGAVVFMAVFVGLVYNHLDYWSAPAKTAAPNVPAVVVDDDKSKTPAPPAPESESESNAEAPAIPEESSITNAQLRQTYLKDIYSPSIKPDSKKYKPWGAFEWELPGEAFYKESLGEDLCIIDLDSRGFLEPGQVFHGDQLMSWDHADKLHGLSTGILNHWVYAKIHGYKYYYIEIDQFEDRRDSWKKPPVMAEILKDHKTCIYMDSDAIFHHMDLPFEWLMNYWQINPQNNSMALAFDPVSEKNTDKFGQVYVNTGFIVVQNNEKTFEIMNEWEDCANDGGKHPECTEFRTNGPGHPTDQGGFGTYTRYDFEDDIKQLPCTEANGFLESHSGCAGIFIKHLWTGKKDWIKITIGEQLPGRYLEAFHEGFLAEKESYYFTEKELFDGKTHPQVAAP